MICFISCYDCILSYSSFLKRVFPSLPSPLFYMPQFDRGLLYMHLCWLLITLKILFYIYILTLVWSNYHHTLTIVYENEGLIPFSLLNDQYGNQSNFKGILWNTKRKCIFWSIKKYVLFLFCFIFSGWHFDWKLLRQVYQHEAAVKVAENCIMSNQKVSTQIPVVQTDRKLRWSLSTKKN